MSESIQGGGSRLVAVKETAKRLCISRRTLEREVARGRFPLPLKIGTKSLFLLADIEKYVSELAAKRRGVPLAVGPASEPDEADDRFEEIDDE